MQWISGKWARAKVWMPRIRDTGAVVLGLVAAADTVFLRFSNNGVTAIIEGVLCVVAAIALWWRRSHPMAVLVLALGVAFLTDTQLAMYLALVTYTIRRRDRSTVLFAVATFATAMIGPRLTLLHESLGRENIANDLISTFLVLAAVLAGGAYIGARRDLLTSLQERAERAEAERELREEQGRLSERTRIAREMHDVLAHKVSLIALQAGGLEVTNDPSADVVRTTAALIRQTARQALEDLRDVLGVLRDENGDPRTVLAPQAALADIAALVESSRRAGLAVALVGNADLSMPTTDLTGRAVYRLVQEALTNVHKHARNASTTVQIDGRPGSMLVVDVVNRMPVGAGTLLPGSGLGLVGLRERIVSSGGTFSAGPTPDGGFRVHAELPWGADAIAPTREGADA